MIDGKQRETPILEYIDRAGSPEHTGEKVVPRITVVELLENSGIHPKLLEEIRIAVDYLSPFGALVLNEQLEATDPNIDDLQGRGMHHSFPFRGKTAHLYAKGTGSNKVAHEEGPFKGYPQHPKEENRFFFDPHIMYGTSARIYGTQDVSQILLEAARSAAIFCQLAKEHQWTSLEEVIDAGVTLPLIVYDFTELTSYIHGKLTAAYPEKDWGDMHLGSILMLVPSNERMQQSPHLNIDRFTKNMRKRLTNAGYVETLGRTIKQLIRLGCMFESGSAHLQNVYAADYALCAQADSGDILCFADIKDRETPRDLVYQSLYAKHAMGTFSIPWGSIPGLDITYEEAMESQRHFFYGLLRDLLPDNVIELVIQLYPVARSEILLALSDYLTSTASKTTWDETAKLSAQFMEKINDKEAEKLARNQIPTQPPIQVNRASIQNKLASPSSLVHDLRQLFETHDLDGILQNPKVAQRLQLLKAVDTLHDDEKDYLRDNISESLGAYNVVEVGINDNVLEYREDFFPFLLFLIRSDPHEAGQFLDALRLSLFSGDMLTLRDDDSVDTYFQRIISNGENPSEVLANMRFVFEVNTLTNRILYTLSALHYPGEDISAVTQRLQEEETLCEEVRKEAIQLLANPQDLSQMTDWLSKYHKELWQYRLKAVERDNAIQVLENMMPHCPFTSMQRVHQYLTNAMRTGR